MKTYFRGLKIKLQIITNSLINFKKIFSENVDYEVPKLEKLKLCSYKENLTQLV